MNDKKGGWITLKDGRRIYINNYMNEKIRSGANKELKKLQAEYDSIKNMFDPRKAELKDKIDALKKQNELKKDNVKEKKVENKQINEVREKQQDYMMSHRPTETGITADNLINQNVESPMPKDAYEHPEYYSVIGKKYTDETMLQLNKVRNNPEAEIIIYRATTGDKINYGDWITLSKSYAEEHNKSQLDNKGKVLEMKVKVKDIQFAGDDLAEWGYFPRKKKK